MGFERCHPAVNFIFFSAVIAGAAAFRHPVYVGLSFLCALIYSIKRNGVKSAVFDLCLTPCIAAFALYYSSYHHFGITVLSKNFIDNNLTLEAVTYGAVLGLAAAGVIMWFSCVFSVVTSDKVVYLFGKVSPRLSLFLAILLRMAPRIKKEAWRINTAQKGIGRGTNQGNILQKIRNCIRIFSMIITWTIESLSTASESMRSRGSSLRGRSAFSIYRFDNRDRAFVVALFSCITLTATAVLLHQTYAVYDPQIIIPPITAASVFFYIFYAVMCLMPMGLEIWTEYNFERARQNMAAFPD